MSAWMWVVLGGCSALILAIVVIVVVWIAMRGLPPDCEGRAVVLQAVADIVRAWRGDRSRRKRRRGRR